ncbi:hypothetical protein SKAU_G00148810 [Synaphobranchus kaupii]|uniref:Uncharacterized protein n=1 Tax=Synaphobranchus kaupii TaxID=118154 RepID=A0A9Q1J554_SYNKA|nr:hypothetical protein SKAU_G00148810 [Synaphobranchus kaupii]
MRTDLWNSDEDETVKDEDEDGTVCTVLGSGSHLPHGSLSAAVFVFAELAARGAKSGPTRSAGVQAIDSYRRDDGAVCRARAYFREEQMGSVLRGALADIAALIIPLASERSAGGKDAFLTPLDSRFLTDAFSGSEMLPST